MMFTKPRTGPGTRIAGLAVVTALGCCGRGPEPASPGSPGPAAAAADDRDAGSGVAPSGPAPGLVAAGRALDAGEIARARELLPAGDPRPEARWLAARAAAAAGDHGTAVALLDSLAGTRDDLEPHRLELAVLELAAAGRVAEALERSAPLVDGPGSLPRSRRLLLREHRGAWLEGLERHAEALAEFQAARELAGRDRDRERIDLRRAASLVRLGRGAEARRVAEPLADSAAAAETMRQAEGLIAGLGRPASRPPDRRLARARRFAELRAFDDALAELEPLRDGEGRLYAEARFERARMLFDRRRHYAEALEALDAVIAEGTPRAEDARFLRAQALSRLDRDEAAVDAYLDLARRGKKTARAIEARFLAARLQYYLGRHGEALAAFEKLAGSGRARGKHGTRLQAGPLAPDQARDAHFLAGMSALLAGQRRRAEDHFLAAGEGSTNDEAGVRNRYWYAVARLEGGRGDGPELLRGICASDGTSWYALWSGARLAAVGQPPGACEAGGTLVPVAGAADPPAAAAVDVPALLEPLSPLAAFFSRAGLYRDAAEELARAEERAPAADRRAWVEAYVAVDAPHRAVRTASRGLSWPPRPEDLWKARAAYPEPFPELTRRVEAERGLPRHLIAAVARKESLFDPRAVSGVGAMGMLQMMPQTYETNRVRAGLPPLAPGELPGPEASIRAAGHELAWLLERFGGSLPLAIMGYNGGAAAVSRWLERSGGLPTDVFVEKASFAQTRNYVRRVWQNLVRYRLLAGEPLPELPALAAKLPAPPLATDLPSAPDGATADPVEIIPQPGEEDE